MKRNLLFLALALTLATYVVAQSGSQSSGSSSSGSSAKQKSGSGSSGSSGSAQEKSGGSGGASTAGDAAAGRRPYMRLCSKCHLPDGKGDQSLAEQLGVKVRALGSPEVQAKSDAELAKESRDGIGQMKPVPGITDKDLANIVAYKRTMTP
jgi:mono/diheme cytochrome c family protein